MGSTNKNILCNLLKFKNKGVMYDKFNKTFPDSSAIELYPGKKIA